MLLKSERQDGHHASPLRAIRERKGQKTDEQLEQSALDFYEFPIPGEIRVPPTKPLATQRSLAPAYSPGVAAPCLEIEKDPLAAYKYTARGSLVAVVSNGTMVLGLGNISALTGKPVMGGKGVLFKKFAGIGVFDTEVDKLGPDRLINVVITLEPVFGGINLEDVKAPECFYIEQQLCGRMSILVFHDSQHGMAAVSTAAILSGLHVAEKNLSDMRMVVSGAGVAAIACVNLLAALGMQKHSIVVCDLKDVIYKDREPNVVETKAACVVEDDGKRTFDDVIDGANIFPGYSGPEVLTPEMTKKTARAPLTLALVSPEPEVLPPLTKQIRDDAIVCTGRSDYPSQVNNVLCFPFIFRGVLGVDATAINKEMKLAVVHATVELAHAEQSEVVASAYDDQDSSFSPDYIIPRPFDPRLIVRIAPAMVRAAMDFGMATRPIADFDAYIEKLSEFVYKTNLLMKPVFSQVCKEPKRVVLAEGEETRVLHTTQELVLLELTKPILVGRPNVIEIHIQKPGLQIKAGIDSEIVNNESGPRLKEYWSEYYQLTKRHGVTQEQAQRVVISNTTVTGAIIVHRGEADTMICRTVGGHHDHYRVVQPLFGYRDGVSTAGAMGALLLPSGNTFITDTHVSHNPSLEELTEVTLMVAESVRRFGTEPRVALLSHSNFGSADCPSASKIRKTLKLVKASAPELMINDEVHSDAALVESIHNDHMPDSPLKGSASILVIPNMEAARVNYNPLHVSSLERVTVGSVLIGMAKPMYILTPTASVRRIVNMVVLTVVEMRTRPL